MNYSIKNLETLEADSFSYLQKKRNSVIRKWLVEIGCDQYPVAYNMSFVDVEIFSTKPGILIGKYGINVDKLKILLKEEFGGEWSVNFIEIRGDFIVPLPSDTSIGG